MADLGRRLPTMKRQCLLEQAAKPRSLAMLWPKTWTQHCHCKALPQLNCLAKCSGSQAAHMPSRPSTWCRSRPPHLAAIAFLQPTGRSLSRPGGGGNPTRTSSCHAPRFLKYSPSRRPLHYSASFARGRPAADRRAWQVWHVKSFRVFAGVGKCPCPWLKLLNSPMPSWASAHITQAKHLRQNPACSRPFTEPPKAVQARCCLRRSIMQGCPSCWIASTKRPGVACKSRQRSFCSLIEHDSAWQPIARRCSRGAAAWVAATLPARTHRQTTQFAPNPLNITWAPHLRVAV